MGESVTRLDVANIVIASVGAVAAVAAAYFGWKSPSQKDLNRVELNTAESAKQIDAVRQHLANVEGHLEVQNDRAFLAKQAENVTIRVDGTGPSSAHLRLRFTLHDSDVVLLRADLFNVESYKFGTILCQPEGSLQFIGDVPKDKLRTWWSSGGSMGYDAESRHLVIRAFLKINGSEASKDISVELTQNIAYDSTGVTTHTLTGEC
jgi:hypothetical protein